MLTKMQSIVQSIARTSPDTTLCVYWPVFDDVLGDGFGKIVDKASAIKLPAEIAHRNVEHISGANRPTGPAILIVAE